MTMWHAVEAEATSLLCCECPHRPWSPSLTKPLGLRCLPAPLLESVEESCLCPAQSRRRAFLSMWTPRATLLCREPCIKSFCVLLTVLPRGSPR